MAMPDAEGMNEQMGWQTAGIASLQLGSVEVLRGLMSFLNIHRQEHHSIDCLKERGVEERSGQHSTL